MGSVTIRELETANRDVFHPHRFRQYEATAWGSHPGIDNGKILINANKRFLPQASSKNSISDSEKREKKMLEKKLSEMEEELKVMDIF